MNAAKQEKVAVVIAGYNEAGSIGKVVAGIPKQILNKMPVDVVVVDDGSSDDTFSEASATHAIVLRHLINRGQGAALKTGFDFAIQRGYSYIVSFDADGQHAAGEIEHLVGELIKKDLDVVLGSRFLSKAPQNLSSLRRFVLKSGIVYTRLLSHVKITDTHNGFRAFKASSLARIKLVQDRMEHASEIIDQIGKLKLKFGEVPVTIVYNDYSMAKGQSNSNAIKIAGKMIMHKLMR